MKNFILSALTLTSLTVLVAPTLAATEWMTDLPAAQSKAAEEGKLLLFDFNGSDWCGPCKYLKSKILDTDEFAQYAQDKLIFVDIDMPKGDKISAEQKTINRQLCQRYQVKAYPTILILDPSGTVVGGFVGSRPQIEEVQTIIDASIKNAPAMQKALISAALCSSTPRQAELLMEAYQIPQEEVRHCNADLKASIMAIDLQDKYGFKAQEEAAKALAEGYQKINKLLRGANRDEALTLITKELARTDIDDYYRIRLLWAEINYTIPLCETEESLIPLKTKLQALAASYPSEKDLVERTLKNLRPNDEEAKMERARMMQSIGKAIKEQEAKKKE